MAHSQVIRLKTLTNTRDLGGLRGAGGKTVKDKLILRSGELEKASEEDLRILYEDHNLRTVIDLRNKTEATQKPDRLYKDIEYVFHPILTEAQMGMTHEEETDAETSEYVFVSRIIKAQNGIPFMKDIYLNFITDAFCLDQYSKLMSLFATENRGALLYHCSVGKDRVGMATYFLLEMLGVSENDIIEDFMLTNDCIEESVVKKIQHLSKRITDPRLEETYRELFQVRKDYIETVMNAIQDRYGSFENFRKEGLHVSDQLKERLREKYLG
jgi:protein-tyrosine phosphatase